MSLPEFFRDISPYFVLLVIGLFLLLLGQGILIIDAPYIRIDNSTNFDPITNFVFTILGIIIMIVGLYLLVDPYPKKPDKISDKSNKNDSKNSEKISDESNENDSKNSDDNYVCYHDLLSIQACNKSYISAQKYVATENVLIANMDSISDNETFMIISKKEYLNDYNDEIRYGDKVAIFSISKKQYVRAASNDNRILVADRSEARTDETFVLEPFKSEQNQYGKPILYGEKISIKFIRNSLYVKCEFGDKSNRLKAIEKHKKDWESFTLMKKSK